MTNLAARPRSESLEMAGCSRLSSAQRAGAGDWLNILAAECYVPRPSNPRRPVSTVWEVRWAE
jgi:hypothetical protein